MIQSREKISLHVNEKGGVPNRRDAPFVAIETSKRSSTQV